MERWTNKDYYMPKIEDLKRIKKVALNDIKRISSNAAKINRQVDYEYIFNHQKELPYGEWELFRERMMAGEYFCLMEQHEIETMDDAGANFYDFCDRINDYRRFESMINAMLKEEELGV
tara:strand:- start:51 stop:407 length:357 start_codon:yes stop_codon:yes gene_type:complete